jgi:hypothetical protein
MATHQDIALAATRLMRNEQIQGKRCDILVYVLNTSDHPVRIYAPGFVGPVLSPPSNGPQGAKLETRVGARFGPGDFVPLRAGEAYSRVGKSYPKGIVSAYYIFYQRGDEGNAESITGILYSDGQWHPIPAKRTGLP